MNKAEFQSGFRSARLLNGFLRDTDFAVNDRWAPKYWVGVSCVCINAVAPVVDPLAIRLSKSLGSRVRFHTFNPCRVLP